MMKINATIRLGSLLFSILILTCCKEKINQTNNVSEYSELIEFHTPSVISIADPITIRFSKNIPEGLNKNIDLFDIKPKHEGQISWLDDKTVVFTPDDNFKNNQEYHVKLFLNRVFKSVEEEKSEFNFSFKTIKQNFEVLIEGIRFYESELPDKVKVVGVLQTADVASFENIKKMFHAKQNNNSLNVSWEKVLNKNSYSFIIEEVSRSLNESEVNITVNGSPIGIDKKIKKNVKIPSSSNFQIMSSRYVTAKENYISVIFSNELDEKQNFDGFVLINFEKAKLVVNNNELKIYPASRSTQFSSLDLEIKKYIKNKSNQQLLEDYKVTLKTGATKPEIRFNKKQTKTIIPSSGEFVLPFEAIGLKSVRVRVFKVPTDNVLQHFQVNDFNETKEFKRVAKPILRKKIDLTNLGVVNFDKWNTFSLDLSSFINLDPGALYNISVSFNRSDALFYCEDVNELEDVEIDSWENPDEESSYWDNSYYYNNYDWRNRDNPCNDSYYGSRRDISKVVFSSNFGIIAKKRDRGSLSVFITDLVSTDPINDVSVSVYDYQQQLLYSGKTNAEGKVSFESNKITPYVLVAKKGDQVGYLKLNDGQSLSLSNFDITGTKVQKGIKGFIYGERGVWRPADTIHLTFIKQDVSKNLPSDHPVTMQLFDPKGQLVQRKTLNRSVGNMYRFDFVTDVDAPTGKWKAQLSFGGVNFYKPLRIETVKPNRLKINLDFMKETLYFSDKKVIGELNARWLTGAKANKLNTEYEMLLQPMKTVFDGYRNFIFDDISKPFSSSRKQIFKGKLDGNGNANIPIDLGNSKSSPGALKVKLYGKVFEEGGDFSVSQTSIPYYPYESFVGLSVPEGDKRGMLLTDKKHKLIIATLDSKGKPIDKAKVKVSIYKLNWRWWWDKSFDNISNYVGKSFKTPKYTFYTNTVNGKGFCDIEIKYPDWGRFYVQVEDLESGHTSGQITYFDWPGWAGKSKKGQLDGASMLDFSSNKEEFTVGEDVTLTIPSTLNNRVLVSLESGKGIIKSFWVLTKAEKTQINFIATQEMTPNVYVHLTMIQPHGEEKNDLPIRLYGIKNIKVIDPMTKIYPTITQPKVLKPEQNYVINIGEENARPMTYTIAVVDEGILDLTQFKTPQPWDYFFSKESLGIKTWDIYDDVIDPYSGNNAHFISIGGDEELKGKEEKTENRFKPVAQFFGPFSLKAGEIKKHKLKMPQYIGSVKTMVVASSDYAYGNTEQTTPVKQPLMNLATLPRVVGPDEEMKLPVNVFVLDESIKDVSVKVETFGSLDIKGENEKKLRFENSGDQVVYFDVKAKDKLGKGRAKVTATSGNIVSTYDINLNVIPRNPFISVVDKEEIVSGNSKWEYEYKPLGIQGENEGVLEVSSLPPINLENRLDYLIKYPHGCIEQTTSSVFPQLFLGSLLTLSEERKLMIQNNITSGISSIAKFQKIDGGFSYWPGADHSNSWGTSYAGHFLLEAKRLGYDVPSNLIDNWFKFQKEEANNWSVSDNRWSDLTQAYRLYTLSLYGKPQLGAMNRLKEEKKISNQALWRLALAYAVAGYEIDASRMIENLEMISSESNEDYNPTFGSSLRDLAMILETLTHLKDDSSAFNLLESISEKLGDSNYWMSTQTTAFTLVAISKCIESNKISNDIDFDLSIDGESKQVNISNYLTQFKLNKPEESVIIKIHNTSSSSLFTRFVKKGIAIKGHDVDEKKNIEFEVNYYDSSDNLIDVQSLAKGTSFKAVVSVSNPGRRGVYKDLALTQIFPSGWEIINTRLDGSDIESNLLTYKDVRDDRVMHYFDLSPKAKMSFTVLLNATYEGDFYMPSVHIEAMYDNSIYATKSGKWVKVISED